MSHDGEKMIGVALVALFVTIMLIAIASGINQGKENDECRKCGGTPVKTERGYTCMKRQ
ncbi:hypothetical protein [Bradyrhizobium sp. BWC-3-1]|uniref:hypothetical protein n=1 Tax=Bradyrhizobium sp. BWC-3-1 TaxID=3080012 RepID=UPI00293E3358|nr:hypothetical protein [Bradyrhizobium sp. BWC-3-1]WOH61927.1 hypothetical protein RX329_18270 [Bradyrhizobium sp. BWC-3-1]